MEIKDIQKIIRNTATSRANFNTNYEKSLRYYMNKNDIVNRTNGESKINKEGKDDPLRSADNRISSNFHQLLVDQEAGYIATVAPSIDVGEKALNNKITNVLGDNFNSTLNRLVIDAANAGVAWLHYWIDDSNNFRYGIIPPNQITAIYSTSLDTKLLGLLRVYEKLDEDSGKYFKVYEYWNDKEARFYRNPINDPNTLEPYNNISSYDLTAGYETGISNTFKHNFGRIPFIAFPKNRYKQPDLLKYKGLIDAYDDIYNGFLNDLDDIQEVVLVLTNYGGTNLKEFMHALKVDKAVKFNSNGSGDKSGVDKLQIDIPTEARKAMLDITRDNIFLHGQGVDPAKFDSTNASGAAIKMLYSHLELKASITESQFRTALSELTRAIMNYLGISDANSRYISQNWERTRIEDDLTKAQVLSQVANWSSKEAIAKANPIVDDWQQELKYQKQDTLNNDPYSVDNDE
ncbi:phage portal protein [Lactobacillus sp. PSON]|uniref:phage portal protein n=1 Tax=Lactobacillus sp. PSON TaxID=3455454 RepID=UPI0040412994